MSQVRNDYYPWPNSQLAKRMFFVGMDTIELEWNYLSNRDVSVCCHWFYNIWHWIYRCSREFIPTKRTLNPLQESSTEPYGWNNILKKRFFASIWFVRFSFYRGIKNYILDPLYQLIGKHIAIETVHVRQFEFVVGANWFFVVVVSPHEIGCWTRHCADHFIRPKAKKRPHHANKKMIRFFRIRDRID